MCIRDRKKKYPIVSIEDGCAENDWDGWKILTEKLGKSTQQAKGLQIIKSVYVLMIYRVNHAGNRAFGPRLDVGSGAGDGPGGRNAAEQGGPCLLYTSVPGLAGT